MCKVAGVTKVTDANRDNVWAMMIALGDIMSRSQRDGLGYAAFDKAGNIFGERWLENDLAFTDLSMNKKLTPARIEKVYNFFGEKVSRDEAQAIILHARMATCGRGLKNTHPFTDTLEKPHTAIIHNGIIANDDEHEKKFSTCDSEVLVHLYEKFKVSEKLENIKQVVSELIGWFTVLNLSRTPENKMILDIYTDARRLNSYYVKELDTRVYSTSAYDIEEAAKILGFEISDRQSVDPDKAYRLDVLTGNVLEETSTLPADQQRQYGWRKIPVRDGNEIIKMEGNADDEAFKKNFLQRKTDV